MWSFNAVKIKGEALYVFAWLKYSKIQCLKKKFFLQKLNPTSFIPQLLILTKKLIQRSCCQRWPKLRRMGKCFYFFLISPMSLFFLYFFLNLIGFVSSDLHYSPNLYYSPFIYPFFNHSFWILLLLFFSSNSKFFFFIATFVGNTTYL